MNTNFLSTLRDHGMKARAIRGTALSVVGFGGGQVIRLISNLILTRILFPEAFGLMALVQIVVTGLEMFSDMGIHPAIIQSKNGEDRDFLNTAWTMQIIRGLFLWLIACLIATPAAQFYGQDALIQMIPVLAFTTVISSFRSTNYSLASRRLTLGRVTAVELIAQVVGTIILILMALWLQSVWALVIGSLIGVTIHTMLTHLILDGGRNKLAWSKPAAWEIFHFGKFIVISTIAGYLVNQGDRLILGKYVSLEELAIFTIAFLFGSLPLTLAIQLNSRVLIPLFKQRPPAESENNFRKIRRARMLLLLGFLVISTALSLLGEDLIEVLYDPRYYSAGPMLVLLSLSVIPALLLDGYKGVLLANGNSRDFTIIIVISAVVKTVLLVVMIQKFGIVGAIIAPFLSEFVTYPLLVHYIRPYRGWHPGLDVLLLSIGVAIMALALWLSPAANELLVTALRGV